ncbi:MAG TPA: hypothetical protein VF170_03500 [Planctomycetaceae bacterium]
MRHDTLGFAVCALIVVGCGGSASTPAQPEADVAPPAKKIDFVHPTTPDELAKTLTAAFDAGDKEALDRLMLWGDATEEQKNKSAARVFFADRAGEYRVLETKILPPQSRGGVRRT